MNLFFFVVVVLRYIRLWSFVGAPLFGVPLITRRVDWNQQLEMQGKVFKRYQALAWIEKKKKEEWKKRERIAASRCDDYRFIGCWTISYYRRNDVSCCFVELPPWWECLQLVEECPPFPLCFSQCHPRISPSLFATRSRAPPHTAHVSTLLFSSEYGDLCRSTGRLWQYRGAWSGLWRHFAGYAKQFGAGISPLTT